MENKPISVQKKQKIENKTERHHYPTPNDIAVTNEEIGKEEEKSEIMQPFIVEVNAQNKSLQKVEDVKNIDVHIEEEKTVVIKKKDNDDDVQDSEKKEVKFVFDVNAL